MRGADFLEVRSTLKPESGERKPQFQGADSSAAYTELVVL